jgi:hypothetical protein
MADARDTIPAGNMVGLLKANLGREVSISTDTEGSPQITGVIEKIIPGDVSAKTGSIVVIKTRDENIVLNTASIVRADFEGEDIKTSVPIESKRLSIRMDLDKEAKGQKIAVSYLARGITWAPSYLIDLSDSAIARLSAKAVVINEAADLDNVHFDLVTGFPNIRFGNVESPMAMSRNLDGFLGALAGRNQYDSRRSVMTQQAVLSNVAAYDESSSFAAPDYSSALEGTVSEDLFFYPVENVTLKKGRTAYFPLFTAMVPYEHVYIWKIPDMLDNYERYINKPDDENKLGEEVWHSCRLVNNMNMPWTTAAAEFVTAGNFTGQDICYYTAPGAETTVRINRAMNVLAEKAELEMDRQRNAARFHGYSYDLITVKGELKLRNRMDRDVTVEITKNLSGEVLESMPQAEDIPTARGLKQVNPRHILIWKIDLKADREEKISYTYEVYVRN